MEKQEIVDEMDHGFFAEQGYSVHADDLDGKQNIAQNNCVRYFLVVLLPQMTLIS